MTLGAVADDRYLLCLNEGEICVVIVISLCHFLFDSSFVGCGVKVSVKRMCAMRDYSGSMAAASSTVPASSLTASAHGHLAAPADFKDAAVALIEHLDQPFNLALNARHLDHQRLRREIDNARAKNFNQLEDRRARVPCGRHLDQRQLASHRGSAGDVVHIEN